MKFLKTLLSILGAVVASIAIVATAAKRKENEKVAVNEFFFKDPILRKRASEGRQAHDDVVREITDKVRDASKEEIRSRFRVAFGAGSANSEGGQSSSDTTG